VPAASQPAADKSAPTPVHAPTPAAVATDASLAGAAASATSVTPTQSVSDSEAMPTAAEAQETAAQNAEAAKQIAQYENVYRSSTDFSSRIDAIYRISDAGTAGAITALGRLFTFETDPELKTEILDALSDVDGQDSQKVVILSAAVSPDQAKDVRQSAIDALSNIDAQKSLPILQNLANDSDSDISESASNAIEQVKANIETSQ
jgi:hypothetical protein